MSILGISKEQLKYANSKVEEIADKDVDFRLLKEAYKNIAISVSAGWPIAYGGALMIDFSEEGLEKIAKGAIIIAKSINNSLPVFNPLPAQTIRSLNTLYNISH